MPRLPAKILYLAIYNPTLPPEGSPGAGDDEDAKEQAHILFYTSRDRAVPRDRMLRQIGLAKALISFSEMFGDQVPCENVHSQWKRMIMVSPEPNFWMHAAVEVARVPRVPLDKGKGRAEEKDKRGKKNDDSKDKDGVVIYDGIEGSLHDFALRRALLVGYEQFKLRHGSFTQIISTLGREALELQLERFFTVWAWSWDLEDRLEFNDHLGIPLHPSFISLVPLLDAFSSELPECPQSILVIPPHVIPSTNYTTAEYSFALTSYLLSLMPPLHSDAISPRHDQDAIIDEPCLPHLLREKDSRKAENFTAPSFLGLPSNWKWPGSLSFERGGKATATEEQNPTNSHSKLSAQDCDATGEEIKADVNALKDAISENIPTAPHGLDSTTADLENPVHSIDSETSASVGKESDTDTLEALASQDTLWPILSITTVHLAEPGDPTLTTQKNVHYLIKNQMLLALVGLNDKAIQNFPELSLLVEKFLDEVEHFLQVEASQSLPKSLPLTSKVLLPVDNHVVKIGNFTSSNPGFNSRSTHLYAAQELQLKDTEISEIFSRGQNPQHWYVARRGFNMAPACTSREGEVYMGIYRKEANLGDVDNHLASVVRRFSYQAADPSS